MIEREAQECGRCNGTGRVAIKKSQLTLLCSCPAGRAFAAPHHVVFFQVVSGRAVAL